jgi:hypothetical protein
MYGLLIRRRAQPRQLTEQRSPSHAGETRGGEKEKKKKKKRKKEKKQGTRHT